MFKFRMLSVASFLALLGLAIAPYPTVLSAAETDVEVPIETPLNGDDTGAEPITDVEEPSTVETDGDMSDIAPSVDAVPEEVSVPREVAVPEEDAVPEEETTAALSTIQIEKPALYPEGIEYNPNTGRFLLSSVREGTIYEIDESGAYRPFIQDERLVSTTGIHIDPVRNRLLVPNTDHGLSLQSDPDRKLKMADLAIYDLTTVDPIAYVDLAALRPDGNHFANDVAVDDDGNAYVTDSVSPILYKVDPMGNASVFLENDRFTGEGFNFNGIIYHPDGYLIVAKKNEGVLFKVPVNDPENFTEIAIPQQFPGADGLVLVDNNTLLVIANKVNDDVTNAVFQLTSDQAWENAIVSGFQETGDVYPTTGVVKENTVYVVFGQLSGLGAALKEPVPVFAESFELQRVGTVQMIEDFVLD